MLRWSLTFLGVVLVIGLVYFRALASVEENGELVPPATDLQSQRSPAESTLRAREPVAPTVAVVERSSVAAEKPSNAAQIRGQVLDELGEIRSAEVHFVWNDHGRLRELRTSCDSQGRFVLSPPRLDVRGSLLANDGGGWSPATLGAVAPGPEEHVLVLRRARTFAVELRAHDGSLVEPEELGIFWVLNGLTIRGDDPHDELWALPPLPFRVHARVPGHADGWFGPFEPETVGSVLALDLRRQPRVRGQVLWGGQGVSDAEVELEPLTTESGGVHSARYWPSARTNAEGRFELIATGTGSFRPRAFDERHGAGQAEAVTLNGHDDVDGIRIDLVDEPGSITGQVILPPGREYSSIRLEILGQYRARAVRADGSFSIPGLEPGLVRLRVVGGEAWSGEREEISTGGLAHAPDWLPQEFVFPARVSAARSTELVLDLTRIPDCRLEGRISSGGLVLGPPGLKGQNFARLTLRHAAERWHAGTFAPGTGGEFGLGVPEPGRYELELGLGFLGSPTIWTMHETLELLPGTRRFDLELTHGELRVLPPDDEHWLAEDLWVRWTSGAREIIVWNSAAEPEQGSRLFTHVPAGSVEIEFPGLDLRFAAQIHAGATTEFSFPETAREAVQHAIERWAAPLPDPREIGYY